jgi:glycosyltransferase involved in cell wall biosynthesis
MTIAAWNHTGFRWVAGIVCQTSEQYEAAPRRAMIVPNSSPSVESTEFVWPRPYAAWIGNIKPAKRPESCVAIARHLLPHGVDLVMVGRMQDSSYRWLEERTQVPENLHYIGVRELEAVNGILRQSLALLHTGMPEGFPNVFIQAWLHGKPTVSLECDPSGVIEKHGLGVAAHGSEELFHQAVCEVVTDETLARQLGANAARFAREHCDLSRNIHRLESLLIELGERRRGSTKPTSGETEIATLTTDRPRGIRGR